MSGLLNQTTKLKGYSVVIGDISLEPESILSFEVSYKNDTPKVLCNLILNDIYDLDARFVWRNEVVTIHYLDLYDNYTKKEYKVLHIQESYNEIKDKILTIELQDTLTFNLERTFTSKGFTTNPIIAIKSYIDDYLKLTYVDDTTSEVDFTTWAGANYNFIVPNNISALDWFLFEFKKHGYTFYQTKTKLCIKSLKDLAPSTLPMNDDTYFTNETHNQLFKNFIHEVRIKLNSIDEVLPKTKTLAYDQSKKIMAVYEINDPTQYSLNDDKFNIQLDMPARNVTQQHLNFDDHEIQMKNSFMKQSILDIYVPGFVKNDLNQVYDVKLSGNKGLVSAQNYGNIVVGGKYISHAIQDKVISDSIIQKISLHRVDLTKKL